MKAQHYINMNLIRKKINAQKTELRMASWGLGMCALLGLSSFLVLDPMCMVASAAVAMVPLWAMSLIQRRIDELEEDVFQHRLRHGFKTIS